MKRSELCEWAVQKTLQYSEEVLWSNELITVSRACEMVRTTEKEMRTREMDRENQRGKEGKTALIKDIQRERLREKNKELVGEIDNVRQSVE